MVKIELLKREEIASVTLFDLRLSESELMAYEACIKYVIENCNENEAHKLTDCTKDELGWLQEDLKELIINNMLEEYLPQRYKK